ncbi:preprotein translocase subunit SecE [Pengzhenrongella sp.]|uniref:preprotein translocase subunit SecE n=1 Tax=Pengzhenrongella sp. TaxID=2888820 RepID=UPI002F951B27
MSDSAAASGTDGAAADRATPARSGSVKDAPKRGLFDRIALFLRQVVAELKKVVRPTRSELVTYTTVVVVFVLVVMAFVTGIDFVIGRLTLWVFGK